MFFVLVQRLIRAEAASDGGSVFSMERRLSPSPISRATTPCVVAFVGVERLARFHSFTRVHRGGVVVPARRPRAAGCVQHAAPLVSFADLTCENTPRLLRDLRWFNSLTRVHRDRFVVQT